MQRTFGAGELSPTLHARADQVKYQSGLRTCRNFIVLKGGGVTYRKGTRFVAECKTIAADVQLIPYYSEIAGESVLIEAGVGYLRFYVNAARVNLAGAPAAWSAVVNYVIGDLVVQGGINYYCKVAHLNQIPPNATFWHPLTGTIYEVPHPFGAFLFNWSQSGRTITLTQDDTPPHELVFETLTRWISRPIATTPVSKPPTNLVLTPGSAGARRFAYVLTTAKSPDFEESEASGQVINAACGEPTETAPHVLTFTAPVGITAEEYYAFGDPYDNGIYGFLGTAKGLQFKDIGFVPDFSLTPPIARTLFSAVTKYPKVCAHYQQRRIFANTKETPDAVFASRIGFPSNFGISSPLQDDDAITFRMAGNHQHPVRAMVGLKAGLVVLTDGGEWTVRGGADGALTPSTIDAEQETYVGAYEKVPPVVVGNSIIYVQSRGSIIRDLQFDIDVEGLAGRDLTVFADHLVKGKKIRSMTYAQDPDSIVWAVRDDGVLLGLTYLREHEVWGWHRHDTDGLIWSACAIPEATQDALYLIVFRTINAVTKAYIERLEPLHIADFDVDCFFVDAGLSYSGAPASNVTGLGHLQGKVVAVVGDGLVLYDGDPNGVNKANFTVNAGGTFPVNLPQKPGAVSAPWSATTAYVIGDIVTLGGVTYYAVADHTNQIPPNATYWSTSPKYSNIHVGLRIVGDLETLDMDAQAEDPVRGKRKRVSAVTLGVDKSSRVFLVGETSGATMRKVQLGPHESPAAETFTGLVDLRINSRFGDAGRVFIQHASPLPLTILSLIPDVELGG